MRFWLNFVFTLSVSWALSSNASSQSRIFQSSEPSMLKLLNSLAPEAKDLMPLQAVSKPSSKEPKEHVDFCIKALTKLPGKFSSTSAQRICNLSEILPDCRSVEDKPIYHYESESQFPSIAKKILVMAVVHGDELESGSVARRWIERLLEINSRNSWRIIPILNPDGKERFQRMNARGVDINRNFPSEDWDELAHKLWAERTNKDPRRNPGTSGGSEPETRCAMAHIEDFKPDFIVAIHTPYGVLDFDGPRIAVPQFSSLPWVSLGTFPGSLGRYMWRDQKVPVLTVELKDAEILAKMDEMDSLQDMAGTVALRASESLQ